ncbi:tudor domain-containing protein [Ditylenchus destructor]|uniref:Tudor domain-containing protein n=1 Tax=Ditylenchus destructor TaxID=166010 RepID=A0AAD4QWJ9_9BILA|nr:tudor domain-containing protein [Ditylenchus destructor]
MDNVEDGNECTAIQTLLCLATGEHRLDLLNRHLPFRILGAVEFIDEGDLANAKDGIKFAISLYNDGRDDATFIEELNYFYNGGENRQLIHEEKVCIGGFYVCEHMGRFYRCQLKEVNEGEYRILLVDNGQSIVINRTNLFELSLEFLREPFNYAFVLQCCSPGKDFLRSRGLPCALDDVRIKEVVEVYICSLHEPCFAIVGSLTKMSARIRPESMAHGMDQMTSKIWKHNFLDRNPDIDFNQADHYPAGLPPIFETKSPMIIAALNSLEEVSVRDIDLCICLQMLQDMLNDFYSEPEIQERMYRSNEPSGCLLPGSPCVVFDDTTKRFLRAKIVRMNPDQTVADVEAVDFPNIKFNQIKLTDVFMLSQKFALPPLDSSGFFRFFPLEYLVVWY